LKLQFEQNKTTTGGNIVLCRNKHSMADGQQADDKFAELQAQVAMALVGRRARA